MLFLVQTGKSFAAFWLVEMGHVNKLMTYSMLMRQVTQNTIAPLSFLRSDWLLPSAATLTTSMCSQNALLYWFRYSRGGNRLVLTKNKQVQVDCVSNSSFWVTYSCWPAKFNGHSRVIGRVRFWSLLLTWITRTGRSWHGKTSSTRTRCHPPYGNEY